MRHGPFGISAAALERERQRRDREHARQMQPLHALLQHLQADTCELTEFTRLLSEEIRQLEAQQQALLRQIADPPPDAADTPAHLKETLEFYRTAHQDLLTAVLQLIAPYLTPASTHSVRADWRETAAWHSDGTPRRSYGSDGP